MTNGVHQIRRLARAVGLATQWQDVDGITHDAPTESLEAVLHRLGFPATNNADRKQSLAELAENAVRPPAFLSADAGKALRLPPLLAREAAAEIDYEGGGSARLAIENGCLPGLKSIGYHRLTIGGAVLTLAIAPLRCHALSAGPVWGPAIQIPSLRGKSPYGTFKDLREAAALFADHGADLVAISPVHALVPGATRHFSPYAPSSRFHLNTALALAPDMKPGLADADDLIDWPSALHAALRLQQDRFAELGGEARKALDERAARDPTLWQHALFDSLSLRHDGRSWQDWPAAFHDPSSPDVEQFARENPQELALQLFGQDEAERELGAAHQQALQAGMRTGLIADLAVGVDSGGSDVWRDRSAFLQGLSIGAPPDPLGPDGQNWGLTTYSPHALRAQGFAPWIAMIRKALRYAGGLRVDHAFGLRRMWVIPEGADSRLGVYLDYPLDDLLRILAIESHRSKALIIGEDLGTPPDGFAEVMAERGILGMSVLWFEREPDGGFKPSSAYRPNSVAMTGTHDTPTVAGWWYGRDLEWRQALLTEEQVDHERRPIERGHLHARLATTVEPSGKVSVDKVVDAAIAHIAAAPTPVKIVPIEDLLGLEEQPNLPGTIDEHPNWRRRLPEPIDALLSRPDVARRMMLLRETCDQVSLSPNVVDRVEEQR